MDWLFILIGLVLLFAGGEASLRGAIGLSKRLGVSPAIIGLTVVGFGTSAPELVVTVQAALANQHGLAMGNVVGSNISNLLLILGVGAMIYPLVCAPEALRRDGTMMLGAMVLLVILAQTGEIVAWQGALMLATLIAYISWSYYCDKKNSKTSDLHEREGEEIENVPENTFIVLLYIIIGLICLVGGAHLLVDGAVNIAQSFNIPESIIGLTIVALGTSLPELAATAVAAARRHTDVAIANIIGSCLFNVLSILGITAMIKTIKISPDIQNIDIWVMLAAAIVLIPLLLKDRKLCRLDASVLLAAYVTYFISLAWRMDYI